EEEKPVEQTQIKAEKRKRQPDKAAKVKKKSTEQVFRVCKKLTCNCREHVKKILKKKKKRKMKKKTITDVLASSDPKPGSPADLQDLVTLYFSDKRSVIELEELKLADSSFLSSNDLTHTLSSYLKQVCPKWAKIQKQHSETGSVVILIVCSSAGSAVGLMSPNVSVKAVVEESFFLQIEEQVKLLRKGVAHIGIGTPGRISALIEKEGLNLQALRYVVLDWNWRDQKLRRMVDIPEIKLDLMKLLENGIFSACKEEKVKLGLF
uniref:Cms1 ribosomal small subunit homolog n=1 Tax=Oryzias latipes TaxID=8090 RepID=A0A3P9JGF9_ORYLA